MKLQLITPEKILFSGAVAQIQVPGTEGDFGVLPGHAPLVSVLREGQVTIDLESGEQRVAQVTGGIAEVTPDTCVLLAESAVFSA